MFHEILVIGGGASGIVAAIVSKDMGSDVAILEGSDRIGKKILTTGNGRCNITNENLDLNKYHSDNKDFPKATLEIFDQNKTIDFFYSLGLSLTTLDHGKMYPLSLQASAVLDVFRFALEERCLPLYFDTKVVDIKKIKNHFQVSTSNDLIFECNKIILCTGGKSAPNTGSDGSGFNLAKALGHNLIPAVPALVQLKLSYKGLKSLSGIKFDGSVHLYVGDKFTREETGEILYTDYGISGPPILQLSRIAAYNLRKGHSVFLKIDMIPNISKKNLKNLLENYWGTFYYRSVTNSFIGLINKKIISTLLKQAGVIDIHKPCCDLTWEEKDSIINLIKNWCFQVTDTNSFANSQVTAGGIDTNGVDSITLQSKLIPGLFFAGEVLDVDGDCGGYNLQWAWSSAYIAALNASK